MKRKMVEQIIRFRLPLLIVGTILTLFFLYRITLIKVRDDPNKWPPENHPNVEINKLVEQTFGGCNVIIVQLEVKDGDIFTTETLSKVYRISHKILEIDGVVPYYLTSLAARKVKYMRGYADLYDISFLMEYPPETQEDIERIKWGVYHNPTILGGLVSIDAKATRIIADFRTEMNGKELNTIPEIYKQIKAICDAESDANTEISYAGSPIIIGWINSEGLPLLMVAFGIFFLIMCVILGLIFRNKRGVMLPLLVGIIISIWAFGVQTVFIDKVLVSSSAFLVPFILMASAACHTVQFLKRYYEELALTNERISAITRTFTALISPLSLALLTDAASFFVIAFVPFKNVSTVGTITAFGLVSLMFCMVLFFIPLLSYFPGRQKEVLQDEETKGIGRVSGNFASFIARLNTAKAAIIGVSIIFIISLWLVAKIDPGMDLTYTIHNYLTKSWNSSEVFAMETKIKDRFKSIYPCNIMIQTSEPDGLKDPEVLQKVDDFASFLTKRPDIGGTMNLATFIKLMNRFVHEEKDEYFTIPDSSMAVSEYLYLYDLADPGSFEFVVDHDYQNSVLVAYADNTGHRTVKEILDSARHYAHTQFNDENVTARIAGGAIGICGTNNEMIKKWIILATIFSLVASFIIAAALFTSLVAPVFLIIPLVIGIIVTFAILYLTGIEIDSNATTVVSMGIGVGIDAGIYLLFRFREEFARSHDFITSLRRSYATSGKALVFSFSALILGCWSVIPIPIYIGHVGFAMGTVLLMNFIFTFTVLPALWSVFKPKFLFT